MKPSKMLKRVLAGVLVSAFLSTAIAVFPAKAAENTPQSLFYIEEYSTYEEYLTEHSGAADGTDAICLDLKTGAEQKHIDGVACSSLAQGETGTYTFSVSQSGFYNLELLYYPVEGADSAIKLDVKLDGMNPFEDTAKLSLSRAWAFEEARSLDSQGNDIRPQAQALPGWTRQTLMDVSGAGGEALRFYLSAGEHTLSVTAAQNPVALAEINFTAPRQIPTYGEVLAQWQSQGYQQAPQALPLIQAEDAAAFSEKSIVMINDRSSAATTPYHPYKVRYNSIGGNTWAGAGQWIQWQIDVPESGLYTLAVRYLQNGKNDGVATRVLTIDGELPFAEAANITFPYSSNWQTTLLGDGETPYQFYLEKGTHTLRMTVGLGEGAQIIRQTAAIMNALNEIYINIVMVTGTSPDTERDYGIAKLLPDVLEQIGQVSQALRQVDGELSRIVGEDKANPVFKRIYEQLELMQSEPEKIPRRLKNYQSNVTALGTWINSSRSQPLMLDYLQLMTPQDTAPAAEKGFFQTLGHNVRQFFGSFVMDYAAVGSTQAQSDRKIKVWIAAGRDQADIIRKIITTEFTPQYGIDVELELVNAGALLPATLASIGPDVCLNVTEDQPVNYALRNAVVDLSTMPGAEEVMERFPSAALTPFQLEDGLYAIPETMEYPMLFYRKDILAEQNIKEEDLQSWDTLLQNVLPELTLSYFNFGYNTDMKNYASLLFQNGGSFYNEEKTACTLDTPEAYSAFYTMTRLYTDYKIPKTFDFANRFRSGEMPLAVMNYSAYNQLSVFAPEIEGKWGMTVLPGIRDENGVLQNTAAVTVTGSIIMKQSKNQLDAWEFLKWWSSGEVQSVYANELETVMGTAARYPVANTQAMESIQWDEDIKAALKAQRENLMGVPQIAGSYYTTRYYDFALRAVTENGMNDRESLLEACENISNEIIEKRREIYGETEHEAN